MIREHEFNSAWWGAPVGIVDDRAFFELDAAEQDAVCSAYSWVEYAEQLDAAPAPDLLRRARFNAVDTQVRFRISLNRIESTPSIERLSALSADESPFDVSNAGMRSFEHERFRFLPGVTHERLDERYAIWANQLIARHPAWCLRISDGEAVQGWYLSEARADKPLGLTLAMLSADARISGQLLYQKALIEYARRGARIGEAAFSVSNTPVMNIYATLGARFLRPRGCWQRWSETEGGTGD